MTEGNHISQELAAAWRERRLDTSQIGAVADHVAACEPCRARVRPPDAAANLAASLTNEPHHLSFEELESLVTGQLSGDEGVLFSQHLLYCAICAEELADLRRFSGQLKERPSPWHRRRTIFAGGLAVAAMAVLFWLNPIAGRNKPLPKAAPALTASVTDSGRVIGVTASGALIGLEGAPPEVASLAGALLRNGELPTSAAAANLAGKRELMLGRTSEEPVVHSFAPTGEIVPGDYPHFRWDAVAGASHFVVSVFTVDFVPVASSGVLEARDWTCTATLRHGTTYSWTVSAVVAGKRIVAPRSPEPELRFRMASGPENAQWDAVRALKPPSSLAQALVALKLGMYTEADEPLSRLTAANARSPIVARLASRGAR